MLLDAGQRSYLEKHRRYLHLYCDEKATSSILPAQGEVMVGMIALFGFGKHR
jgi:uncharacterized protein YlbG (UPF0298 family)